MRVESKNLDSVSSVPVLGGTKVIIRNSNGLAESAPELEPFSVVVAAEGAEGGRKLIKIQSTDK